MKRFVKTILIFVFFDLAGGAGAAPSAATPQSIANEERGVAIANYRAAFAGIVDAQAVYAEAEDRLEEGGAPHLFPRAAERYIYHMQASARETRALLRTLKETQLLCELYTCTKQSWTPHPAELRSHLQKLTAAIEDVQQRLSTARQMADHP